MDHPENVAKIAKLTAAIALCREKGDLNAVLDCAINAAVLGGALMDAIAREDRFAENLLVKMITHIQKSKKTRNLSWHLNGGASPWARNRLN
jgi:hypothetical protein